MRQRTVNALRAIAALTEPKCSACPTKDKHRCCSQAFCQAVAQGMARAGLREIPRTDHPTLMFMGENGCIVPPEHRPGCSGYVCRDHLEDRAFRRKWERLHDRFVDDPDVATMMRFDEYDHRRMFSAVLRETTRKEPP